MKNITFIGAALLTSGMLPAAIAAPVQPHLSDPGVINHERIEYWLKKRGELQVDADRATIEQRLQRFTQKAFTSPQRFDGLQLRSRAHSTDRQGLQVRAMALPDYADAQTKTVKVLGILIDFPDLKHDNNRLQPGDSGMYYPSYPVSHYQNLLFSANGFSGPDGQTLQSGRQFYSEESGNSFTFDGQVFGWLTADHNAAHYGGNAGAQDNDQAAPDLVLEAVTKLVASGQVNLADFDQEDQYDLDNDGNLNEPDGIIDHIMLFHSSIGEEAGGGVLGADAIWSHRFFVFDSNSQPVAIPNSDYKVYGYTVQPIDAAAGVCTHEFGHDLGLPDEYDTGYSSHGSPVGSWSLMSGGSWTGSPAGSEPSSMSAYARDYLQTTYGGRWIDATEIDLADLNNTAQSHELVSAINHDAVNQLKITLPPTPEAFYPPYSGSYQYYSGSGNQLANSAQWQLTLPAGNDIRWSMKAHWAIETDYDYLQLRVNGTPISASHSKTGNPYYANLGPFYTGNSTAIAGAEGDLGWVTLEADLGDYAGQTVTLSLHYITDAAVTEYGFVADDIEVSANGTPLFSAGAEQANELTLNGFIRTDDTKPGADRGYFVQLRQFSGNDRGLARTRYNPGVLMWHYNAGYSDNNVGTHPGYGFAGVVDADQVLIPNAGSATQIQDATFSIYTQKNNSNDSHLDAISRFDDSLDYSAPEQPQSGLVLPKLGLVMTVTEQAADASTATVTLQRIDDGLYLKPVTQSSDQLTVTLNADTGNASGNVSYRWDLGDGSAIKTGQSISHTYAEDGSYTVTLTATDDSGASVSDTLSVTVTTPISGEVDSNVNGASVSLSADLSGGVAPFSYRWDLGNGSSSTEASPQITYANSGDYTVVLTATDALGTVFQQQQQITVVVPLAIALQASSDDLQVSLSADIRGGATEHTLAWSMGDDTGYTQSNVTHSYAEAGTYTVTLTVTDALGQVATQSTSVTVTAPSSGGSGGGSTPDPEPPVSSGGGGGGSLGWFTLLLLPLMGRRLRR
ncbi:immune inhibitor A domain-containing protein [Ferrimonas kyonanensis]|uniref:immune inhibitor A domain-containing protein n=1 Tax=Ferrimonas kyonanensis TaxID=364763 RepID=UPI00041879D7|nr:immune inhibitor A domain-containing protein [Ferrimonas kyonanensis]